MNLKKITEKHLPALVDHPDKIQQKTKDFVLGWIWVAVGAGLALTGCLVAVRVQHVVLSLSLIGGGIFVGNMGSNMISRELSRAARKEALEGLNGVLDSLGGLLPGRRSKGDPEDE